MINTYSKFYYGIEVTADNKYLDFDEGAGELTATVAPGFYTPNQFIDAVEDALNLAGLDTYTVTLNRTTRIVTIATTGTVDLLWDTGTNAANTIGTLLGFVITADDMNQTSIAGDTAIGSSYSPQFKLQDYVDETHSRKLRQATKNISASGLVEVLNFGTDRFYEFSIKFATDIYQPANGPIVNNSSGVASLETFMQWVIRGGAIEFMPDSSDVNTYETILLESTSADGSGMGYKLQEQYGRGLVGYFETGLLKFRILEV